MIVDFKVTQTWASHVTTLCFTFVICNKELIVLCLGTVEVMHVALFVALWHVVGAQYVAIVPTTVFQRCQGPEETDSGPLNGESGPVPGGNAHL